MVNQKQQEQVLRKRCSEVGQALLWAFPETDLRLNRIAGSDTLSILVPENSPERAELALSEENTEQLVWQAIFSVKQLLQRFDD